MVVDGEAKYVQEYMTGDAYNSKLMKKGVMYWTSLYFAAIADNQNVIPDARRKANAIGTRTYDMAIVIEMLYHRSTPATIADAMA